jgi:hypothetical protein
VSLVVKGCRLFGKRYIKIFLQFFVEFRRYEHDENVADFFRIEKFLYRPFSARF